MDTSYPEIFHCFTQYLKVNDRIIPQIIQLPPPPTSFPLSISYLSHISIVLVIASVVKQTARNHLVKMDIDRTNIAMFHEVGDYYMRWL
jgi:hypothetical protein